MIHINTPTRPDKQCYLSLFLLYKLFHNLPFNLNSTSLTVFLRNGSAHCLFLLLISIASQSWMAIYFPNPWICLWGLGLLPKGKVKRQEEEMQTKHSNKIRDLLLTQAVGICFCVYVKYCLSVLELPCKLTVWGSKLWFWGLFSFISM